jgi:hypothetical protein
MLARLYFPGAIEGEVSANDANTNKPIRLTCAEVAPIFYRADGKPPVLHVETVDAAGNVIKRYAIMLSGASGELTLIKRNPCTPKMDLTTDDEPNANENEDDS